MRPSVTPPPPPPDLPPAPAPAPAPALEVSQDEVYAIIGRLTIENAALRRLLQQAGAALAEAAAQHPQPAPDAEPAA